MACALPSRCDGAGFGLGIVLRHMRRHAGAAQIGNVVGILSLVRTHRNAPSGGLGLGFQHPLGGSRSAVPVAWVTVLAWVSFLRFWA